MYFSSVHKFTYWLYGAVLLSNIQKITIIITSGILIAITFLMLAPLSTPKGYGFDDKTYHILAFAGLIIPIATLQPRWLLLAIPLFILFGGMIELIQPYFGRTRDLADWIADIKGVFIGSAFGLFLSFFVQRKLQYIASKI